MELINSSEMITCFLGKMANLKLSVSVSFLISRQLLVYLITYLFNLIEMTSRINIIGNFGYAQDYNEDTSFPFMNKEVSSLYLFIYNLNFQIKLENKKFHQ